MSKIGLVIPHYNTTMWTQISTYGAVVASQNSKHDIDIIVINNADDYGNLSYKNHTISAITDVDYFNEVTIINNPNVAKTHGTALDCAVRYFKDIDYLLCWESDIAIFDSRSIDWVIDYMDNNTWMAGYEIRDFNGNKNYKTWYIMPNPGIYRFDLLKEIDKQVTGNNDNLFYYGENYRDVVEEKYRYKFGVFSEQRGFKQISDKCPDGIGKLARNYETNNLYNGFWGMYENGQWLFFKVMRDYSLNSKSLYSNRLLVEYNGELAPSYTEFGDGLFKHYWAGTRSWDFLTHREDNLSQITYVNSKITTEMNLWKQIIPPNIRKCVRDIYNDCRNDEYELDNLMYIYNNKLGSEKSQRLSLDTANWYKREFLETDFGNLL